MKKLMLVLTLLLFSFTSFAADKPPCVCGDVCKCKPCNCKKTGIIVPDIFKKDTQPGPVIPEAPIPLSKDCRCNPCYCVNQGVCKCEKHYPDQYETHEQEIDEIVKNIENGPKKQISVRPPIVTKSQRLWVQDVYQDGLWYYGYYASVNGSWEFRYSRREYKGALSNFRSLYSVQYKYELRNATKSPVKVVYEPAY